MPVCVRITNTVQIAGDESLLLFDQDVVVSVSPSVKMLKGFEKVHLEAEEGKIVMYNYQCRDLDSRI